MDPLTHATLGAAAALAVAPARHRRVAAVAGAAAGVLPDADVFIGSPADPLLAIEYHRHFTHALVMQPVLAALAMVLVWALLRPFSGLRIPMHVLYLPALAAGISHVICDAWTSYGTRIWWPFSDARVAWDLTSVIDPLFTVPVLLLTIVAICAPRSKLRVHLWPWVWVLLYLGAAMLQQQRALGEVERWMVMQNRQPQRITVKPSFGNIIVWRAILDEGAWFQALAVRPGLRQVELIVGEKAIRLEHDPGFPGLPPDSVQAADLERFRHFSDNWLALVPQGDGRLVVGDMRYAMSPRRMGPLWGIGIDPEHADQHVDWVTFRELRSEAWAELGALIRGEGFQEDSAAQ